MTILTRRRLLAAIAQIAAAGTLTACVARTSNLQPANAREKTAGAAGEADGEVSDTTLLASVCFDLFPFDDLPPQLYVNVARRLLARQSAVVNQGLEELKRRVDDSNGQGGWADLSEAERVAILSDFEHSDFFVLLRTATIEVIYREPEMFELIGYGGSAIDKGGYINRGFDDISWLPQE